MIPDLSTSNTLGPYRLIRTLGRGGMGVVHLAFDENLQRHVAIKILHLPETHGTAAAIAKRFLREAQLAVRLNHGHVVTIYALGQDGKGETARPYIVMEYVDGGSLADHLRAEGPMDFRAAAKVIRDACLGLQAAHDAGIIHRDIKPANLLRNSRGVLKLCDFGLARVAETPVDAELTFAGAFVGSPSYASPEQAAGSPRVDARTDIYALAATWYALLTGQPPFVAEDAAAVLQKHLTEAFPDVRRFVPEVPAGTMEILWKASRKEPGERYGSAGEMGAVIECEMRRYPVATTSDHHGDHGEHGGRAGRGNLGELKKEKPKKTSVPSASSVVNFSAVNFSPENSVVDSIAELESRLADARGQEDSASQIATLRSLFGLYSQTDRREDAVRAARQAIYLHIQARAPERAKV